MAIRTVYCVQPYTKDGDQFVRGRLREYGTMSEALSDASSRRLGSGGVLAFYVEGEPDFDWWSDPNIVASFGNVPRI